MCFFLFCFSDQEPPYSMITLHEMAETGESKTPKTLKNFHVGLNCDILNAIC